MNLSKDLTFKCTVKIAKGIEVADKKSQQFKKVESGEVNKLTHNRKPSKPCYRCGKQDHGPSACYFKEAIRRKFTLPKCVILLKRVILVLL